jgi:SAM-dependent methyltransferase
VTGFDAKAYWESRLRDHDGLDGVGFLRLGRCYNAWLYRVRRQVFLRRLRPFQAALRHADVLDVGSGTGFYLDRWRELGVRSVTGSDLTEVATTRLRRRYPDCQIHQLDIGGSVAPLQGRQFGAISAVDVLFHIVDDARFEQAVRNLHRLLEPGGLLVFSDNLVHRPTTSPAHQANRTLRQVQQVLGACGFQVLQRRPMFVLMNGAPDARGPLAQWLWLAIAGAVSLGEPVGWLLGALLYPLELLLVGLKRESQSTELVICRREAAAGQGAR